MERPSTAGAAPTAWGALAGNPLRFLTSSWPFRSWLYLAGSSLVGLLTFVAFLALALTGIVTSIVLIGIFLLASIPLLFMAVGDLERRRLTVMSPGQPPLPSPHPRLHAPGPRAWLRQRRKESIPGRELGYGVILAVLLWWVDIVVAVNAVLLLSLMALAPLLAHYEEFVVLGWSADSPLEAVPVGIVGFFAFYVFFAYVATALAAAQVALARILLGASDKQLEQRITELRRSRLDLVDAFETERRRIERHLHDGVQQRLVALTMTLGRAELDVPEGPGLDLVRQAHGEAEAALSDLREAVRGIHPRVLIDHGIEAAVHEVADRMPIPVAVDITLSERLPAPIEAAAYFVVSEAITNVARHAEASSSRITGWVHEGNLVITVTDDGVGARASAPAPDLPG
ncbi:sensor histidine kinase [Nocardioides alcanivorans]|uniref:sensor histidine kinase n=1 Tax=Nocardioides alcanivorans TaxID=2897352 RepID=UPI001F34F468|nr:sensor histidine kinase [Nocardioides alcanivorans]